MPACCQRLSPSTWAAVHGATMRSVSIGLSCVDHLVKLAWVTVAAIDRHTTDTAQRAAVLPPLQHHAHACLAAVVVEIEPEHTCDQLARPFRRARIDTTSAGAQLPQRTLDILAGHASQRVGLDPTFDHADIVA